MSLENLAIDLSDLSKLLSEDIEDTVTEQELPDLHDIGCALYFALTQDKDLYDCDVKLHPYIEFIETLYREGNYAKDTDSIKAPPARIHADTTMQCLV